MVAQAIQLRGFCGARHASRRRVPRHHAQEPWSQEAQAAVDARTVLKLAKVDITKEPMELRPQFTTPWAECWWKLSGRCHR
jgi:hypothetical protein